MLATPNARRDINLLRSQGGACADGVKSEFLLSTSIRACARTGSPFTTADSNEPLLVTHLDADTFPDADPSSWLVTVTGPDGKEIFRGTAERQVPEVGLCSSNGCRKWSVSLLPLRTAWRPGTYRLLYVCTFDTRRVVDLTLTLEGAISPGVAAAIPGPPAPPTLFISSSAPKNPWTDVEQRSYRDNCTRTLAAKYGAARTSAQIQYACECITWSFQDRYALADLYRLGKEDPNAVQDATISISAECKKNRPAALGPDPDSQVVPAAQRP
jgi:hypothetical protein